MAPKRVRAPSSERRLQPRRVVDNASKHALVRLGHGRRRKAALSRQPAGAPIDLGAFAKTEFLGQTDAHLAHPVLASYGDDRLHQLFVSPMSLVMRSGRYSSEDAKMIGMTPAWFTFIGR